jgi:catechol 2,3-dioxygenase-like lactoylglutathione lyase family enzyme
MRSARMLHWVLKTPDRTSLIDFLHTLGMHALRHEEFGEACKATCNGADASGNPYEGAWSKTMVGYGDEAENFVLEVTYTYAVKSYDFGNDLAWIKIRSRPAYAAAIEKRMGTEVDMRTVQVRSPTEGFTFRIVGEDPDPGVGPIVSICLHVSDLQASLRSWTDGLGLLEVDHGDEWATLSCGATSATLRLCQLPHGQRVRRGTGYGRLAFAVPAAELSDMAAQAVDAGFKIQTPLVTLETPHKADVQVVILSDPDGHEVCLVGEEGFAELSRVDESAPQLLGESIAKDGSGDWFTKRGKAQKTS